MTIFDAKILLSSKMPTYLSFATFETSNLVPRVLSYPPFVGRVGENPGNEVEKREEGWSQVCPLIVSGILTGDAPVSYWPIFFSLSPVTVPEVFTKVNQAQFSTFLTVMPLEVIFLTPFFPLLCPSVVPFSSRSSDPGTSILFLRSHSW